MTLPTITAGELITLAVLFVTTVAGYVRLQSTTRQMGVQIEALEADVLELKQAALTVALMERAAARLERAVEDVMKQVGTIQQSSHSTALALARLEERTKVYDELRSGRDK